MYNTRTIDAYQLLYIWCVKQHFKEGHELNAVFCFNRHSTGPTAVQSWRSGGWMAVGQLDGSWTFGWRSEWLNCGWRRLAVGLSPTGGILAVGGHPNHHTEPARDNAPKNNYHLAWRTRFWRVLKLLF